MRETEREKVKKGLKLDIEWLCSDTFSFAIQAFMYYLDDYFTVGPPLSPVCASQVHTMVKTADRLGITLAPDKLEGPTTRLVFLGN